MAVKKKVKVDPPYEESMVPAGKTVRIILAIVCWGISALSIYLAFAVPQEYTAMQNIQSIILGISGKMPVLLSFMMIWIGVLCVGSARGKRVHVFHVIMYLIMFLSIFAAVHMFSAQTIINHEMAEDSFGGFIAQSFTEKIGGGILGSLISYYLFRSIGLYGGFGVCIILVLITLVATGRAARLISWGKRRADQNRDRKKEVAASRDVYGETMPPITRSGRSVKGNSGYSHETIEEKAERRQQNIRRAVISTGERDSMYIPEKSATAPIRKKRNNDNKDSISQTGNRRSARNVGIDIPKPMSELKKNRRNQKPSNPSPVRVTAVQEDEMFNPASEDSSVSAEVMSVVAQEIGKKKDRSPASVIQSNKDGSATEQDIEDIFTIDKPERKEEVFEPVGLKPRRKTNGGETDPHSVITDDGKRMKRGINFIETEDPDYNYPPIDLLERGEKADGIKQNEALDRQKAEKLIETLKSFGINTKLTGIAHGPAVTRYELQPDAGIKVSRITSLSDDIALALAAESVRIEAPIPGKAAVGVEIPNDKIETVHIRDVLESSEALRNASKIAVALGKDNSGRYVVADIAKMPHVLIAGQTGSGKSVCINSIITSILYRATPEDVRMILIDPKVVELSIYNDIPHLIAPVVTDPKKASSALQWAVSEMLGRYKKFSAKGVRNIIGYNSSLKNGEERMPQIVIIIDELADLMMAAPGEVEDSICRIAQLARAAGMHLVIATQRPSVNVVTGIIKANIPTRIAFAVASQTDSRVMIDHGGAEKLLGYGDMLFVPNGGKTLRVQGTWVSDDEVHEVVSYIKERCETNYDEDVQEKIENSVKSDAEIEDSNAEFDERLAEAVEIVVEAGQASVSMLQRRMRVGYSRAGRLIDEMEKRGIVSESDGAKPRNVLISREQFKQMFGEDI